jgi:hypothetical protein
MCSFQNTAQLVAVAQFNPNSATHLFPRPFAVGDNLIRVLSDSARIAADGTVNSRETQNGVKLGDLGGRVTRPP